MKSILPRGWLFPLAILAFTGGTVKYLNLLFNTTTRWAVVAVLAIYLLGTGGLLAALKSTAGALIFVYAIWCVSTTLWSEVPDLSFAKSFAQLVVIAAFVGGGIRWVDLHGARGALSSLLPLVVLAAFAGLAGVSAAGGEDVSGGVARFKGLTGNSNMLGSLAAMAMPLLMWQCYRYRTRSRRRLFWWSTTIVIAAILAWSVSRSAIGATLVMGAGLLLAIGARRSIFVGVSLAATAGIVMMIVPEFAQMAENTYIRKGGTEVLSTRAEVWAESYTQALKGGLMGGGFGVTIGDTDFKGGLTAIGYGREQGNTQLAVWEQTGIIGLGIYALVVVSLVTSSWSSLRASKNQDDKAVAGLLLGALVGFLFMSIFEAWWVAPGSPESAFFWGVAGLSEGIRRQIKAANPGAITRPGLRPKPQVRLSAANSRP